jgi:hypothetical protein
MHLLEAASVVHQQQQQQQHFALTAPLPTHQASVLGRKASQRVASMQAHDCCMLVDIQ